jgi:hypothetical protein
MEYSVTAPNLRQRVSVSAAASVAVILLSLAAFLGLLPSLLMPLHEDVQYVTRAAWALLHNGNLSHSGVLIAFQVLRADFHFTSPYWLHYFTPVLYFYSIFLVFGATDWAFYIGQAILIFGIGRLLVKSGMGWRGSTFVLAVSILTHTIFGSICESASQLPSMAILAYFWLSWEDEKAPNPLLQGMLLALGWDCRVEAFVIGMIAVFLNSRRWTNRRARASFILRAVAAAGVMLLALSVLRRALGAPSSHDQEMLVWMSDILAPGYDTWGLASLPSFHDVLVNPSLWGRLLTKVLWNAGRSFTATSLLRQRPDGLILLLPLILAPFRMIRLRNYWLVGTLLALQLFMNATMASLSRYFDAPIFFCLWTLTRDLKNWIDDRTPAFGTIFRAGLLITSGLLLAGQLRGWRRKVGQAQFYRTQILAASEEAHRLVSRDAFVITDFPQLWTWYGRGDFCCFVPLHHPDTMRLILEKFPRAYIILFTPGRAGYSMAPFHRAVVTSARILILGPHDSPKAARE